MSRKRANKNKKVVTTTKNEETKKCEKCSGKECKCKQGKKSIYEMFPARTLSQQDANKMKELFTMSNNVSALIRDYAEKELAVLALREEAKNIKKDRKPLMLQIAKGVFRTENDYNKLSNKFSKQADELEKSMKIVKGQIAHRYEDYVSMLIHLNKYIEQILNNAELKSITGYRTKNKEVTKKEEMLFEKEFEKVTDDEKKLLSELSKETDKTKRKDIVDNLVKNQKK